MLIKIYYYPRYIKNDEIGIHRVMFSTKYLSHAEQIAS